MYQARLPLYGLVSDVRERLVQRVVLLAVLTTICVPFVVAVSMLDGLGLLIYAMAKNWGAVRQRFNCR